MGTAIALPLALVLAHPVAGPGALPLTPPAAAGMQAMSAGVMPRSRTCSRAPGPARKETSEALLTTGKIPRSTRWSRT